MATMQPPPPGAADPAPVPAQPSNTNNGSNGNGSNNGGPLALIPGPANALLPPPPSQPLAATPENNNNVNSNPTLFPLPKGAAPGAPQPSSPATDETILRNNPFWLPVPTSAPTTLPFPPQQQQPFIPQTIQTTPTTTTTRPSTRNHHATPRTTDLSEPSETPYYWPENPDNEPDANAGIMLTVSLVVIFLVLACMGLVVFCLFRRRSAKRRMHLFSKGSSSTTLASGFGDLFIRDGSVGGAGGAAAAAALHRDSFQSLGRRGSYFGSHGDNSDISRALQEMSEHHQKALLSRRSTMSPPLGARGGGSGYWSASGSVTPLTGGVYGSGSMAGGGAGSSSGFLASTNSSGLLTQGTQSQGLSRSNSLIIGSGANVAGSLESSGEFRNSQVDDYYGGTTGPHHAQYLYPGSGRGSLHYSQNNGSGGVGSVNLSRQSSLSPGIYPQQQQSSVQSSVSDDIGQQQDQQNHRQPPHLSQHQHPYHPQSFQGVSSDGRPTYPMPHSRSPHAAPGPDTEGMALTGDGIPLAGSDNHSWTEQIESLDLGSPTLPLTKDRFDDGEQLEAADERSMLQNNQQRFTQTSIIPGDGYGAGVGRPHSIMAIVNQSRPASSSTLVIPPSITTRRRSDNMHMNAQNVYSNLLLQQQQQQQQKQQHQHPYYSSPYQPPHAYYQPQRPQVYPHQQPHQQGGSQPSYFSDPTYSPNPQESVTEFGPTGSSTSLSSRSAISTPLSSAPSCSQNHKQEIKGGAASVSAAGDVNKSAGGGGGGGEGKEEEGRVGPVPTLPAISTAQFTVAAAADAASTAPN